LGTGDNKEGTDESNTNLTAPEKYVTSRKNDGKSEVDAQNELESLSGYIEGRFIAGISVDKIKKELTDKNWNAELVDYYTSIYAKMLQDAPKTAPPKKKVVIQKKVVKTKPKEPEQPKPKEAPKPSVQEGNIEDLCLKSEAAEDKGTLVYNKNYSVHNNLDGSVLEIKDGKHWYALQDLLQELKNAKSDQKREEKTRGLLKKYHSALHAYEKELQRKFTEKGVSLVESKSQIFEDLKALQQGKQAFEKGEKVSKEEPVRNIDRYSKAQYAGHVAAGGLTAAGLYLADKFNVAGEILTYFNVNMSDHQYINAVLNTLDNTVSNLSIPTPFGIIPGLPDVPILPEILIGLGIGAAVAYGNVKKQARIVADTAKRAWHKMFKESIEPPQESDSPPKRSFWSFGRKRYAGPVPPPMTPPPALFDDEDNNYDNDTGNQSNLEDKLPPQGPPANDSGFVDVPEDDVAWSDQAPPQPQQPQNYTTYTLKFKDPKTQKTEYLQPFKYTLNAAGVPVYANGQPVPPKIPFRTPDGRKLSIKVDSQPLIKKYNKEFKQQ